MTRSTKREAIQEASRAEFAEATGVLQRIRAEFPEVINEMTRLLIAANKASEDHLHEFALDLDGIIYIHGRRLNSPLFKAPRGIDMHPDYLGNQSDRRDRLEKAVQLLKGLTTDLRQLDVFHLTRFATFYSSRVTKLGGPSELFNEVESAIKIIEACEIAYSTTFPVRPRKQGRRPIPYVEATRELIDLWQRYSGKKVPVSKTHHSQVATNAAEFVRLGISLIDPKVSDASVVTAINNALAWRS